MKRWSELSPYTRGSIRGTIIGYAVGVFMSLWAIFGRSAPGVQP